MTSFLQPSVSWRLIFSCFSFFWPSLVAFAESPNRAWLKDFNTLAEEIIQYHQSPGIAMAIVTPSQVLALKTRGVRQLGEDGAIDEHTIFRVASVSKTCTSALVAQLAAQGRIDIEVPLVRYLPNIQVASPEHTQQLKIKHLLSHTTGLPGYSLCNEAYRRQDFEVLVSKLKSIQAVSAPGKVHQYQNVLYSLLGPVIESVTQTSFTSHLKKSLFQPLGITDYALNEKDYMACENVAKPHLRTRRRATSKPPRYKVHQPTSYYDNILPAGGMGFSIKEMAKLLQAFMGGYPNVLENRALKKFHAPLVFIGKGHRGCKKQQCNCKKYVTEHYGLGWRVRHFKEKPIIYHTGALAGYVAEIAFSNEEKIGIVILTNSNITVPQRISNTFFEMLFDEHHRRPAKILLPTN